jgi:hypothetical protein
MSLIRFIVALSGTVAVAGICATTIIFIVQPLPSMFLWYVPYVCISFVLASGSFFVIKILEWGMRP